MTSNELTCHDERGLHIEGHLPAAGRVPERDFDSWSHIEASGTHLIMVRAYPWSALQQGAEVYLRWLAHSPTNSRVFARTLSELQDTLARWDTQHRDAIPSSPLHS